MISIHIRQPTDQKIFLHKNSMFHCGKFMREIDLRCKVRLLEKIKRKREECLCQL